MMASLFVEAIITAIITVMLSIIIVIVDVILIIVVLILRPCSACRDLRSAKQASSRRS